MNYPVVIHKEAASDYGASVPDLPGCVSAGRTLDDALANVREAIELHIEGLIDEGLPVPTPQAIEQHQRHAEYRGGTWAVVSIAPSTLRLKAIRINVTIPERTLDAIDAFAAAHGKTRSGLLVEAATAFMGRGSVQSSRPQRKRNAKVARSPKPRSKGR